MKNQRAERPVKIARAAKPGTVTMQARPAPQGWRADKTARAMGKVKEQ